MYQRTATDVMSIDT